MVSNIHRGKIMPTVDTKAEDGKCVYTVCILL